MRWLLLICLFAGASVQAQVLDENIIKREGSTTTGTKGSQVQVGNSKDSLNKGFQQRDDLKDSITISYRYLDSTRRRNIDSSIHDFDTYFSVPSDYLYLGNNGAAARSLIFNPYNRAGFDAGFHAYDVYRFKTEETKIYRTTRPFSMLGYQLASGKEQMLMAMHTQNPLPNLNVGFDYRLITAPGLFVTQNNNHNSYRLFGHYTGKRKRYQGTFVFNGNTIRASQNGGIVADSMLKDPNRTDRFSIPVNMGNRAGYQTNPFNTRVNTGVTYKDITLLLRQSWDLGQRDSIIINDTLTEYLFYPRLRLRHTLQYDVQRYRYNDVYADSALYANWYDVQLDTEYDTFELSESWKILSNEFSVITFPDAKNPAQFLQLGAIHEYITGTHTLSKTTFSNVSLQAEYRNRTRNKLWDFLLKGRLFITGYNKGDYQAEGSFSRYFGKRWGDVQLHFVSVNKEPSYIYNAASTFNLSGIAGFSKVNHTTVGAVAHNAFLTLGLRNHFIVNYLYFDHYYKPRQWTDPINVLQIYASRKTRLSRKINLYTDIALQQSASNVPVQVPLLYTRNRLAFEGNFFKNLHLSTGIELRYYSPYHADNFSPVISQFTYQDTVKIKNRPDVAAYLHFRIRSFTGYIRAENLNTMSFEQGFGFTHNNFAAPHYPTQGLIIRFGIRWWFVN